MKTLSNRQKPKPDQLSYRNKSLNLSIYSLVMWPSLATTILSITTSLSFTLNIPTSFNKPIASSKVAIAIDLVWRSLMRSSWQTEESEGDSLINEGTGLSSLNSERGERGQGDSEHQLTTPSSLIKPYFSNNIFISHSAALSLCNCSSCLANSLFPSDIQQGPSEGAGLQPW